MQGGKVRSILVCHFDDVDNNIKDAWKSDGRDYEIA